MRKQYEARGALKSLLCSCVSTPFLIAPLPVGVLPEASKAREGGLGVSHCSSLCQARPYAQIRRRLTRRIHTGFCSFKSQIRGARWGSFISSPGASLRIRTVSVKMVLRYLSPKRIAQQTLGRSFVDGDRPTFIAHQRFNMRSLGTLFCLLRLLFAGMRRQAS